ncbi:class I SAM-dependent methyltransferase [Allonocardiopsis opalescens]|uniref:Putative O-methyltransferase YrrM n=1 Tax=Allonocardiopsis opalescens TaxID=1144618 RepID=A0A2T0QAM2_9ACTN|nr:class I SAM-dependent methyltransferase [Allonocardiopsis opalescens]PRY00860.1 putative O-methyltransferase YrrM [Allonocardiopsis opalescens]
MTANTLTDESVSALYRAFATDLRAAREAQRRFLADRQATMKPKLDDIEAEMTYLLLRELRPRQVVEIGTFHGWSTSWLLRALADNGEGQLHSYDLVDNVKSNIPDDLAEKRWTFHHGDVRNELGTLPPDVDYLFIDAAHSGRFAHWYIEHLFPKVPSGTPVSVHDVFHGRRPLPFTEGAVLLRWLADKGVEYFTPAQAKAPETHRRLMELKESLGIAERVHDTKDNPMVFFRLP